MNDLVQPFSNYGMRNTDMRKTTWQYTKGWMNIEQKIKEYIFSTVFKKDNYNI